MKIANRFVVVPALAVFVAASSWALAEDKPKVAAKAEAAKAETDKAGDKAADKAPAAESKTEATIEVGGQKILYTAIAGTLPVGGTDVQDAQLGLDGKALPGSQLALNAPKEEKDGPPVANIFYVAYMKKDAKAEERPVVFFYNGGPGSASVWLHMGSLGPKHVVTPGDTHLPAAPYKLIDNAYSLLDVADLVFIDMPGTGFGRLTGSNPEKAFWGIDQDANAFARFITRFVGKYQRWNSPKFLFGESYGTTRSAVLADILENRKEIDLNGVVLLSQIFNFTSDIDAANSNPGVDLPYVLALPTYAATAWYHKKAEAPALEPFLRQAESFATGEYAQALALGTDLGEEQKKRVAEKLHGFIGLPVNYLIKAGLRVTGPQFEKMLLDEENLTTGRLDTRYSGPSLNPLSEAAEYDPQSSAVSSAYVTLFNDYVRRELKYGEGMTYLSSAQFGGGNRWDFAHNDMPFNLNVSGDMAEAMKTNPRLKVLVLGGYYDLATPYYAAVYEQKHLPIPQTLVKNIEYDWYESGHMVYLREESLKQLHDRVAAFVKKALAAETK